jgi:ABC-type uncharacterized transport system fused permease/ATPase subunit
MFVVLTNNISPKNVIIACIFGVAQASLQANVCYPKAYDDIHNPHSDKENNTDTGNDCATSDASSSSNINSSSVDCTFDQAQYITAINAVGLCELSSSTRAVGGRALRGMSGGQRQRVSFARAIYSRAELVSAARASCLIYTLLI